MQITLSQFEAIDAGLAAVFAHGDFATCADPRGYIRASNILFDLCVDAIGYDAANAYESGVACAADITTRALLSADFVVDSPFQATA